MFLAMKNPKMDPQIKKGTSVFSKFIPFKKIYVRENWALRSDGGSFKYTPTLFLYPPKNGAKPPRPNKTPITQKVTGII